MTILNDEPPDGMGWIPLVIDGRVDPTFAWAEIRPFGGRLYGQIRTNLDQPACFALAAIEPGNKESGR